MHFIKRSKRKCILSHAKIEEFEKKTNFFWRNEFLLSFMELISFLFRNSFHLTIHFISQNVYHFVSLSWSELSSRREVECFLSLSPLVFRCVFAIFTMSGNLWLWKTWLRKECVEKLITNNNLPLRAKGTEYLCEKIFCRRNKENCTRFAFNKLH